MRYSVLSPWFPGSHLYCNCVIEPRGQAVPALYICKVLFTLNVVEVKFCCFI